MNKYVIIPAYQPDERLVKLTNELLHNGLNVVVVDDGSGDKYKEIFSQLYCRVISYPENHGKGYALKRGYKELKKVDKDFVVVTCDCDGQHSLADIIKIGGSVKKNSSALFLGKREFKQGGVPLKSRLGNVITSKVFNIITASSISDTQTGLRAFSSKNLERMIEIRGDAYEYEMNVLMKFAKEKRPIIEIPIETIYNDNNDGSHFKAVKDSVKIYAEILKYVSSSFISFIIDFILFTLFLNFQTVLAANIMARLISATVNFNLNRKYVFKSNTNIKKAALKYAALAAGTLSVNSAMLVFLTGYLSMNDMAGKIIVEVSLFIVNWLVQKNLIFRKRREKCINVNFSQSHIQ